jgi:hypothetical protein
MVRVFFFELSPSSLGAPTDPRAPLRLVKLAAFSRSKLRLYGKIPQMKNAGQVGPRFH